MVRRTVVLVMIGLVAGSAVTWARSATANTRAKLTIPPLTSLAVSGTANSGQEILVSVEIPTTTSVRSSGPVELKKAVVLVVRSNVRWTLVARPTGLSPQTAVAVRAGQGEYRPVRPEGLVLATGGPGVHELVLDYQVASSSEAGRSGGRTLTLLYSVEG